MIIDGRLIDASPGNDVSHAGILKTLLREKMDSGFDNRLTGIFSRTGHAFPFQTTV
jgi:hypothetical protein